MTIWKNENGMTFYTLLLTLTLVIVVIQLQSAIITSLHETTYLDEITIQQSFHFIQNEVNQATQIHIDTNLITLTMVNGDKVTIQAFQNLIRRQVNQQGHDILVRGINQMECVPSKNGFTIFITSLKGETYEKAIIFEG